MSSIKNISTRKFLQLEPKEFERYHTKLKHLGTRSSFLKKEAKPLGTLTYGQVINIKRNISNHQRLKEIFTAVFGVSQKSFYRSRVVDFYQSFNWIVKEINAIIERENEVFKPSEYKDTPLWKQAGVERLQKFGELNTIISFCSSFGIPVTEIEQVENLEYRFVFALRYHQHESQEIEKAFFELKRSQPAEY